MTNDYFIVKRRCALAYTQLDIKLWQFLVFILDIIVGIISISPDFKILLFLLITELEVFVTDRYIGNAFHRIGKSESLVPTDNLVKIFGIDV